MGHLYLTGTLIPVYTSSPISNLLFTSIIFSPFKLVVQGFSPTANWIWFNWSPRQIYQRSESHNKLTAITHSEFTPIILSLLSSVDISSPNDQFYIFMAEPYLPCGKHVHLLATQNQSQCELNQIILFVLFH